MATLALITARRGSKRILEKNIKEFCGNPIIAYNIKAPVNSGLFDEIMVSTASSQIFLVMSRTVPFVMLEEEVQDIDNESDWKSAEMKYQLIKSVEIIDGGYGRLNNNFVPISRCIPFVYLTVHREVA